MIRRKDWTLEQDLAALLDALTAELLAAPDSEVESWLRESGPKGRAAVEAVRRLATAAASDAELPSIASLEPSAMSMTRDVPSPRERGEG